MSSPLAPGSAEAAPVRDPDRALKVYVTAAERAAIRAKAEAEALSVSAFARALLLGYAIPDRVAAAAAIGQLGRVGSNLNQLVRRLNEAAAAGMSGVDSQSIDQACRVVDQLAESVEAVSAAIEASRIGRPREARS